MRDGPRLHWQKNGTRARARARLSKVCKVCKVCKVVANMAPLMAIAFTQIASGQLGRRLPPSTPFALIRDPVGKKRGSVSWRQPWEINRPIAVAHPTEPTVRRQRRPLTG
jgi:hypothetical protein